MDVGEHTPAAAAVAVLMRRLMIGANAGGWMSIDAAAIEEYAFEGLGIERDVWPLSISQVIDGLGVVDAGRALLGLSHEPGEEWLWPSPGPGVRTAFPVEMTFALARSRLAMRTALAGDCPLAVGLGIDSAWTDPAAVASGEVRTLSYSPLITDGDCVVLDGWDDDRAAFSCRFMAGSAWGQDGRGWIPYDYACSPLWVYELIMMAAS